MMTDKSNDIATTCDECDRDIPYHKTCYLVKTGETVDDLPVARVMCEKCYLDGRGTR